ncbi:hypothetical protein [Pseudohongiella acticola]
MIDFLKALFALFALIMRVVGFSIALIVRVVDTATITYNPGEFRAKA